MTKGWLVASARFQILVTRRIEAVASLHSLKFKNGSTIKPDDAHAARLTIHRDSLGHQVRTTNGIPGGIFDALAKFLTSCNRGGVGVNSLLAGTFHLRVFSYQRIEVL